MTRGPSASRCARRCSWSEELHLPPLLTNSKAVPTSRSLCGPACALLNTPSHRDTLLDKPSAAPLQAFMRHSLLPAAGRWPGTPYCPLPLSTRAYHAG